MIGHQLQEAASYLAVPAIDQVAIVPIAYITEFGKPGSIEYLGTFVKIGHYQ